MKLNETKSKNKKENQVVIFSEELSKNSETNFSKRQLEFNRDSQIQLLNKYKNKKYSYYKNVLFNEIIKKYKNSLRQKEKLYKDILNESQKTKVIRVKLNQKVKIYKSFIVEEIFINLQNQLTYCLVA